jgi:SNF2 family DNA or RNA helicase
MQADAVSLLYQLEEEGFMELTNDGGMMGWAHVYRMIDHPEYAGDFILLGLPKGRNLTPVLDNKGTLIDSEFSVRIVSWLDELGKRVTGDVHIVGGIATISDHEYLLPAAVWRLRDALQRARAVEQNTHESHLRNWSHIRHIAIDARAKMSDYLRRTIVLTPDQLDLQVRKSPIEGDAVVEIVPHFKDAPRGWISTFDRFHHVLERYEITDDYDVKHVIVTPDVKNVLTEIKRYPGRRIVGDRAEAFLRNPFSVLGPEAVRVIDAEKFEKERERAGVTFYCFTTRISKQGNLVMPRASIVIEERGCDQSEQYEIGFDSYEEIARFLENMDGHLARDAMSCEWKGYALELMGDTQEQLMRLRRFLDENIQQDMFTVEDVYNLSKYSDRILGFGDEQMLYSSNIQKKSGDTSWFPQSIDEESCYTMHESEQIYASLDENSREEFQQELDCAIREQQMMFTYGGHKKYFFTPFAESMIKTHCGWGSPLEDCENPSNPEQKNENNRIKKMGLIVKSNISELEYQERCGEEQKNEQEQFVSPDNLRSDIVLKEHQKEGVEWLLKKWRNLGDRSGGVLLADDMGLGKTLQLLTFMVSIMERNLHANPFLVVAPVALLENWKEEIEKFFKPNTFKLLTLYGDALAKKRASYESYDKDLLEMRPPKLLKKDWIGDAQLVLTTYETMRDFEVSLAAQRWTCMVCDEAQKIKNPNAMVTRSAKKQNARMKIACTGTPVENSLVDLWCLFDYVQAGHLGTLRAFGQKYRKPIEAKTAQEKSSIETLRGLIDPLKLRRTKTEVAKDLPKKIEDAKCRALYLSQHQQQLYKEAVAQFRSKKQIKTYSLQSPLQMLHHLRKICSDPSQLETSSSKKEYETTKYIVDCSPKMKWLIMKLEEIRQRDQGCGEKAIIFCEFKELQRKLQKVIVEYFGFTPDIINGDTSADGKHADSRQKRIRIFQEQPGFSVIVLSPVAVGFGVNIQAANHVIHFTRTWNPAKEDQATDRAYRIGQTKDVYVYLPTVVSDDFVTFDAKLDELLTQKRNLSHDMLNGASSVKAADFIGLGIFSRDDLDEMEDVAD